MDIQDRIDLLARRISELAQQQSAMSRLLLEMIDELEDLKKQASIASTDDIKTTSVKTVEFPEPVVAPSQKPVARTPPPVSKKPNSSFEEFIGKNLASKVGILVTIVGIFIGTRYAIEHNLVSPVVRIISGYCSGTALVLLAIFLKKKYEGYSSVLMGGGLAVLYFITYTAHGIYDMMPQTVAFMLMLIFTGATVYSALVYNRVIIAHVGLVGAYAIPFLLSDNSGRYAVLFTYMSIINAGILVLSLKKYWKSLFYAAFSLTWLIYGFWHLMSYSDEYFTLAFTFLSVFFALFYATFLAYKLVKKEKYGSDAVIILLSNAFIFYGFGYDAMASGEGDSGIGLFTVINAAIHIGVSQLIKPRVVDKALYYLVFGLSIVFITIAVPVQFDGNWVTLLWMAEAALMFIVGRTQRTAPYEKGSSVLLILGFISLIEDWMRHSDSFDGPGADVIPFANIIFISGLLVMVILGIMIWFARSKKYPTAIAEQNLLRDFNVYLLAIIFLLVGYIVFLVEIHGWFMGAYRETGVVQGFFTYWDSEVTAFRFVTIFLYSVLYIGAVVFINLRRIKNSVIYVFSLAAIALISLIFLVNVSGALNELSANYFQSNRNDLYFGIWSIAIRYILFAAMGWLLYSGYRVTKTFEAKLQIDRWALMLIHAVILGALSAEYLQWTGISGSGGQYKLGLSILWGVYALYLIIWGIYKKQIFLRWCAIILFIITLVKLFVYDLAESGTITKTVSFISLGVILLLVSYLYHRYKEVLFGKDE